jgi:hypothetical protein
MYHVPRTKQEQLHATLPAKNMLPGTAQTVDLTSYSRFGSPFFDVSIPFD